MASHCTSVLVQYNMIMGQQQQLGGAERVDSLPGDREVACSSVKLSLSLTPSLNHTLTAPDALADSALGVNR